jgi:hypothetical protein
MYKAIGLVVCVLLAGCSVFQPTERVDKDLVARVPDEKMGGIREAREKLAHEQDEATRAALEARRSQDELTMARSERDVAAERLRDRELKLEVAKKNGGPDSVAAAEKDVASAHDDAQAAEKRIRIAERRVKQGQAMESLAKTRVSLAEAQLELAKARAVNELDAPDAREVKIADFEEQVRRRETDVRVAEIKAEAAKEEVAHAESAARPPEPPPKTEQPPKTEP